ncbi:MAG: hypothetical protein ACO1N0_04145 [Fluviicola sp.]
MKFPLNQKRSFLFLLGICSLVVVSWLGFSSTTEENTINEQQKVLLFRDHDGLYQYDLITRKEKLIFKIADSLYFLENSYRSNGDTIFFGTCGEIHYSECKENHTERNETYTEYYYTSLISKKETRLASTTAFTVANRMLTIQSFDYPSGGNSILTSSIKEPFSSRSGNDGYVQYNQYTPRFYSSNTLKNQTVYSYRGAIYRVQNNDTSLLVENKDGFDPKFGRGNFDPQIHPNKKYVLFNYLPGAFTLKDSELRLINLETKKVHTIKSGSFKNPSFSTDGKFILFDRYNEKAFENHDMYEVFVLNLSNYKETSIGEANQAYWLK